MPTKLHDIDFPHTHWAYLTASVLWVGRIRPAPGTWGSLVAIPPAWGILYYTGTLGLILMTLLTLHLGAKAINTIGVETRHEDSHDASVFVIDEVVGQWIALLCLPLFFMLEPQFTVHTALLWSLVAFITFRLCDILKPWPCKWIDRTCLTGWGVMWDDVAAGLQALAITIAIYLIFA